MPVPANIMDALNALEADYEATQAAIAADVAADTALAQAQANKATTSAAVTAARAHQATDLQALIILEQQAYGVG